jgi:hypothetical protein
MNACQRTAEGEKRLGPRPCQEHRVTDVLEDIKSIEYHERVTMLGRDISRSSPIKGTLVSRGNVGSSVPERAYGCIDGPYMPLFA